MNPATAVPVAAFLRNSRLEIAVILISYFKVSAGLIYARASFYVVYPLRYGGSTKPFAFSLFVTFVWAVSHSSFSPALGHTAE